MKTTDKITFTEGFEYKGFTFGWRGRKLFRLPTVLHNKEYSLRKVPIIDITDNIKGYRIVRDRKSMSQVLAMTDKIKVIVKKSICKQC